MTLLWVAFIYVALVVAVAFTYPWLRGQGRETPRDG